MAENKIVNGVVLRTVNYRDFDRMLTLFTREEGRLSACARGAHRQKSPLSAASTLFCTGEYVLEEKNGRFFVKSCMLDAAYYPLREDPVRLAYASALVQVCEEIVQPGQPMPELCDCAAARAGLSGLRCADAVRKHRAALPDARHGALRPRRDAHPLRRLRRQDS